MIIGHDFLGLGSHAWDMSCTSVALQGKKVAIGCFDGVWPNAFGDPTRNLEDLIHQKLVSLIRINIWWSYQHQIIPMNILQKRLPHWQDFANSHKDIPIYISHSCEYQEKDKNLIDQRVNAVRKLAPSCIAVSTPMNSYAPKDTVVEQHGKAAHARGNQASSTDGNALFDINADHWVSSQGGIYSLAWGYRYNLSKAGSNPEPNKRFTPPNTDYIKGIDRILSAPEGKAPDPVFHGATPLTHPYVYKTFAEDSGDTRSNKPCLIIKEKVPLVEIITFDAKIVMNLGYYDTFESDGEIIGYRYYSGYKGGGNLYAYQIAEKAKRLSGSEFVWFRAGNRIYGPANGAFRTGYYL